MQSTYQQSSNVAQQAYGGMAAGSSYAAAGSSQQQYGSGSQQQYSQQYSQQQYGASSSQHAGSQQYAYQSTPAGAYQSSAGRMITGGMSVSAGPERVQSTRKVSSTIVNEQIMGPPPQDLPVREIEVPGPVQEVVTHVPRKEVIETEKRVPKYEYEYVDKIIEVPRIEYVDKVVEVPKYEEVIREVKVPQIVDVPREVVREVKIPKVNYIEKTVEVPGEIIEVPKPYTVEQKIEFTRYTDKKKPVVVAQTVKPVIVEGAGVTEVDVYEYEPECVPVDVHVVKAVQAQVQAGGVVETVHRVVTVPSAQYNTMLQQLNTHLNQTEVQKLPYLTERGQVTLMGERVVYSEPQAGIVIQGLDMNNMVSTHVDQASRRALPVNDSRVNMQTPGYVATSYGATNTSYTTGAANSYVGGSYTGAGSVTRTAASYTTGPVGYSATTSYTGPTQVYQQPTQMYSTGPIYSPPQQTYAASTTTHQYSHQPITNYA